MKSADDIKEFIKKAELSTHPDTHEQVFEDMLHAQQETIASSPVKPDIWRFVMRHPITKYAFIAVIVLATFVGFSLFNKTEAVAWAIEQSIEVLSKYNAMLVEGSESDFNKDGELQQRDYKWWGTANEDQTKVEKVRIEVDGVPTIITNGQETWRYDPQTSTVIKNRPYGTPELWCGSRFFRQLKAFQESGVIISWEETYGKDPATGKQRAFLTCAWLDKRYNGPRSLWFEFDVESKLLISVKQWENSNWEGPARIVSEKIKYYENLPDDLFEFEIPEGATVIEE
jgi:outer membrane lipoprotein-sorting protein